MSTACKDCGGRISQIGRGGYWFHLSYLDREYCPLGANPEPETSKETGR